MKEVAIQGIRSDSRSLEMLIDDINNYSKILLANQTVQKTLQVDEGNIKTDFKALDRYLSEFINFNSKVSSIYNIQPDRSKILYRKTEMSKQYELR